MDNKLNKEIAAMRAEAKRNHDKIVAQEKKAYEISEKMLEKLSLKMEKLASQEGTGRPAPEAPKKKLARLKQESVNSAKKKKPSMLSSYK